MAFSQFVLIISVVSVTYVKQRLGLVDYF